ncbi:MAG: excinuclease ABC subunit UvrA, partial [Bacteroidota bacterium]
MAEEHAQQTAAPITESDALEVFGARAHNLKNIDVSIPRNQLVVITGLSGSGKSSLAFDTIYAEGQRRYIDSFSAYARQFLGSMERPDVDKITGLSPVISIEQKTVSRNPRSTVGTITEIYDFMRLLFARASEAFSYVTGEKMVRYTDSQILEQIKEKYAERKISLLAPVVKGRKGHYRELFQQIRRQGFLRVRVDGEVLEVKDRMQVDRYKIHDIEIVIDRMAVTSGMEDRIAASLKLAMSHSKGVMMVLDQESGQTQFFSRNLMCPTSGIAYDEPAPNLFSFNSPYGACSKCNGLGVVSEIDVEKVMPDPNLSIKRGGIAPLGEYKNNWVFQQVTALGEKYGFKLTTPVKDLSKDALDVILFGTEEQLEIKSESLGVTKSYSVHFEGVANIITRQNQEKPTRAYSRWAQGFMNKVSCPECHGARLNQQALYFKVDGHNIAELADMDIEELRHWFQNVEERLSERQNVIAREVLKEIRNRIDFLMDVGLDYLTLHRSSRTLSGGEAQRIRLATQIGSQLVGVLYILDEPSIGLHQRDNLRLINALKALRDTGNSVIVVEHDKEMILAADHVLDIGPLAGIHGGQIVAQGAPDTLHDLPTLTA